MARRKRCRSPSELAKLRLRGRARRRVEASDALADELRSIGQDCAARLKEPWRSADHGDLLYDDKGLPQ
jgi:antitoxin VapB